MCLLEDGKSKGIVLRRAFTGASKISLLDWKLGKVDAYIQTPIVGYGMLVQYAISEYSVARGPIKYSVTSVEPITIPWELSRERLSFFHHVLEICYYFVPLGSSTPVLFDLLIFLYDINQWKHIDFFEDLFLCKLLVTLGFFPEEGRFRTSWFCRVAAVPIDTLLNEHVDLERTMELRAWVRACLLVHPLARYFKTMRDVT